MDVDWSKTNQGRKYYNTQSAVDFAAAGISHVRIRIADKVDQELLEGLDRQIRDTIRQFMQERSVVGWADDSSTLGSLLNAGKKIIITTIYTSPSILSSIGTENNNKQFAIIIDEAHSSQTGSLFAKMNMAVSGNVCDDEEDIEDKINKLIEGHRMVRNANYYAFTATPKNKTLEMFGDAIPT